MPAHVARIYDTREGQGMRILVDRLWPRGISRERAGLFAWFRDIAPSHGLRKKYAHMPGRFRDFRQEYLGELAQNPLFTELVDICRNNDVVLLYAARDRDENNAVVLLEAIMKELGG